MAYSSNKTPAELSELSSLATNDTLIVGDTSDTAEVVKKITAENLYIDIASSSMTMTNKILTTPTITLKQSAAPTPTAEGDIQWDTDDNKIVVGDGATSKTFVPVESITGDISVSTAGVATFAVKPLSLIYSATFADTDTQIDTAAFTAYNFLQIFVYNPGNGAGEFHMRFNGDSGSNYSRSVSVNGGAIINETSQTQIDLTSASLNAASYWVFDVHNIAAIPKFVRYSGYHVNTSHYDGVALWNNSSDQITSIDFIAPANFVTGFKVYVYGAN